MLFVGPSFQICAVWLCFSVKIFQEYQVKINKFLWIHIWIIHKLDIEKRLTIAFKVLINADYHHGDEFILSDLPRGRKCVANCVVFLIKTHYEKCEFQNWGKHELHNILHGGDLLYQKLRYLDEYDSLRPSCIPWHMKFDNAIIKYNISETWTGSMSPHFKGVSPLFSLGNELATIFNAVKNKFMLFAWVQLLALYTMIKQFICLTLMPEIKMWCHLKRAHVCLVNLTIFQRFLLFGED